MNDGGTSISATAAPAGPFCKDLVVRRMLDSRVRRAEGEFEISFGDDGRWRYANTLPESSARRDVLLFQEAGAWLLRVNLYRGNGTQLLCDDAEWPGGVLLGSGVALTYEQALGHAIRWLSDGRWSEEIG